MNLNIIFKFFINYQKFIELKKIYLFLKNKYICEFNTNSSSSQLFLSITAESTALISEIKATESLELFYFTDFFPYKISKSFCFFTSKYSFKAKFFFFLCLIKPKLLTPLLGLSFNYKLYFFSLTIFHKDVSIGSGLFNSLSLC